MAEHKRLETVNSDGDVGDLGVLGDEKGDFFQGQLSSDVEHLEKDGKAIEGLGLHVFNGSLEVCFV